jgi:hypothetical protein
MRPLGLYGVQEKASHPPCSHPATHATGRLCNALPALPALTLCYILLSADGGGCHTSKEFLYFLGHVRQVLDYNVCTELGARTTCVYCGPEMRHPNKMASRNYELLAWLSVCLGKPQLEPNI